VTEPHRATEVTIGEVYRLTLRIDSRLDQITRDMVGREEYESDQEGVRERIEALAAGLADERKAREAAIREQGQRPAPLLVPVREAPHHDRAEL